MFLVGNIRHPNLVYFQCSLGVEIEQEFPVPYLYLLSETTITLDYYVSVAVGKEKKEI